MIAALYVQKGGSYFGLPDVDPWLFCVGNDPPALDWRREAGTHQVGWFDRAKPTLSKRAASSTPPAFREVLLSIARGVA